MPDERRTSSPLGCQARPWLQALGRHTFAQRLPEVMTQIAAIGFTGFETALDCLPLDDPPAFRGASERANGLVLAGAHAGGRWWAPEGEATVASLASQAGRLPALGCTRLVVSMQPLPPGATAEQVDRAATTLAALGRACHEAAGVAVLFHNHASEVAYDAWMLQALVETCAQDEVALAADLGWVAHAGMDVVAFVRRFGPRIAYLHARDVTAYGPPGGFIEVGHGVLDYPAILDALAVHGYDGWLIAESEFSDAWRGAADPRETAHLQFQGLRRLVDAATPAGWRR